MVAADVTASADAGANPSAKLKVDDTRVIFCGALAPPPSGVCSVTPGDMSLLIRGNVLGFDTIYQGGEVVVDATGLIQYVGCGADRPMDLDVSAQRRQQGCAATRWTAGASTGHQV